jgi:hypothetical protein
MKLIHLVKFIFLQLSLSTCFVACRPDKPGGSDSPAYQIAQSEKLLVPAGIDLPLNQPGGNTRVATFYAVGIQKYAAQLKAGSPSGYEWKFVAPQATLYDVNNHAAGTHSASPAWQLYGTSDAVYGQAYVPARVAASPDGSAIDWLLLMPKAGTTATGIFKDVSYIQRIATTGGRAPAAAPANAGETVDVPYTAVYRFTKKNP